MVEKVASSFRSIGGVAVVEFAEWAFVTLNYLDTLSLIEVINMLIKAIQ